MNLETRLRDRFSRNVEALCWVTSVCLLSGALASIVIVAAGLLR